MVLKENISGFLSFFGCFLLEGREKSDNQIDLKIIFLLALSLYSLNTKALAEIQINNEANESNLRLPSLFHSDFSSALIQVDAVGSCLKSKNPQLNKLSSEFILADMSESTISFPEGRKYKNKFAAVTKMLNSPETDIDIGLGNLLIGKIYHSRIDVDKYANDLDQLASEVKRKIGRTKNPNKTIRLINDYIFGDFEILPLVDPYPEDFLLHELLKTKKGRCMSLVALYLTLSDRLNLPLQSICVPEHIFVRWYTPKKKTIFSFRKSISINIETTLKGISLPSSHYEDMVRDFLKGTQNDFYLKPLSRKETLAAYLSPLSDALRQQGRINEAIESAKLALSVNPQDSETWNNLGVAYRKKGYKEMAVFSYNRAIHLNPNFAEAWQNLGRVQEDNKKRIEYLKKAISIKPQLKDVWGNLVLSYYENKDYDLAWACARRCQSLGYMLPKDLLRKIEIQVHAIGK